MGLAKLKIAFEEIKAFRPSDLHPEGTTSVLWDNEVRNLIRLAGEFLIAFEEIDDTQELLRRHQLFSELIGPNSSYERARQEVVEMLRQIPGADDESSGEPLEDWGKLYGDYWGFVNFHLLVIAHLGTADILRSKTAGDEQRAIVVRYREELWQVNKVAERQHLWGTTLLGFCASTLDPKLDKHYDFDRSQEILLAFRLLEEVVTAIQAAAISLYQVAVAQARLKDEQFTDDLREGNATDRESPSTSVGTSVVHSVDFRSVNWFGEEYSFTPVQAACVKVLWKQWKRGTPEIGGGTILDKVRASSERLPLVFRDHPAWGTMITEGKTKGSFRLNSPEPK